MSEVQCVTFLTTERRSRVSSRSRLSVGPILVLEGYMRNELNKTVRTRLEQFNVLELPAAR